MKSAPSRCSNQIGPRGKELIQDLWQVRWRRHSAGNPTGDLAKSDPERSKPFSRLSDRSRCRCEASEQSGLGGGH